MSDHFLVGAKLKVKGRYWRGRREARREGMRRGVEVIRTGELGMQGSKRWFQETIEKKWSMVEGREVWGGGGMCSL